MPADDARPSAVALPAPSGPTAAAALRPAPAAPPWPAPVAAPDPWPAPVAPPQPAPAPRSRRSRPLLSAVALVLSGVLIGVALPRAGALADVGSTSNPADPLAAVRQVYDLILQQFAGKADAAKLVAGAIQGMLSTVGDPFSTYFNPGIDQAFTDSLAGFVGVGIDIVTNGSGDIIQSVVAGGPAQQAGLRSGELIVTVDGHPTAGLTVAQVATYVRGPLGTQVRLLVSDPFQGKQILYTLTRAKIQQPTVFGSSPAPGVGLIRINEFGSDTADEFDRAYASLRNQPGGLQGLILDLRNDPGGYLSAAQHIAGALAPTGSLFQVVDNHGTVTPYSAPAGPVAPPMVVLVNGMTASAAEIVAGALRYRHVAVLVGSKTYGKGSVQELFDVPGGGAVKLTIEHDELPDGTSWDHVGLQPDVPAAPAASPLDALPQFPKVGTRDVAPGMIGLDVLGLQEELALLGNFRGTPDGIYSPNTLASVEIFQHLAGLPVTGTMGAADWKALATEVAAKIDALKSVPLPDTVLQKGLQVLQGLISGTAATKVG